MIGGGADEVLVRQTAQADIGQLPVASATDPTAFTTAVVDFARWRLAQNGRPVTMPALFVFSEYPARDAERLGLQRMRGFRFSPTHEISGALVLTSASLGEVFVQSSACTDETSAFEFLHAAGLSAHPVVILLPHAREIIECRYGTDDEGACARITIRTEPVTIESVDELLTDFHRHWIEIPTECAPIWHKKDQYVPCDRTEKRIQGLLLPLAHAYFARTHLVRPEDNLRSGRSDITILPHDSQSASGSCVLELKVLRAKSYHRDAHLARDYGDAQNAQAIAKGITQALNYRRNLHCRDAFLCAYDMRKRHDDDEIMQRHAADAAAANVELRRYFAFNSSEAFRRAQPGAVRARRRSSPRHGRRSTKGGGDLGPAGGLESPPQPAAHDAAPGVQSKGRKGGR